MIEFFDTTALVAAMVEDEAHHEACAETLENADEGCASVHTANHLSAPMFLPRPLWT